MIAINFGFLFLVMKELQKGEPRGKKYSENN
jgi:hypothetical protein